MASYSRGRVSNGMVGITRTVDELSRKRSMRGLFSDVDCVPLRAGRRTVVKGCSRYVVVSDTVLMSSIRRGLGLFSHAGKGCVQSVKRMNASPRKCTGSS